MAIIAGPHMTARIVVAEDDTHVRTMIDIALRLCGDFEVVGLARDGSQLIEAVLAQRPDAIVLDLDMPSPNGLDVIPELRALSPNTRILVFSGQGGWSGEALERGAHGYLEKQAGVDALVAALTDLVEAPLDSA